MANRPCAFGDIYGISSGGISDGGEDLAGKVDRRAIVVLGLLGFASAFGQRVTRIRERGSSGMSTCLLTSSGRSSPGHWW